MKKKLLSLVLAGAMVASTSVSAFADAQDVTVIRKPETETGKAEIKITGEVTDENGQTVPGTLNVTVPTTASFAITQGGNFTTAPIKITNYGNKAIDVFAYEFIDVDGPSVGIKIDKQESIQDRTDIALSISGGVETAYFKSEVSSPSSNKGVYKDPGLISPASDDGVKIANVDGGGSYKELTLHGEAGTSGTKNKAASNEFRLRLKIKKSQDS